MPTNFFLKIRELKLSEDDFSPIPSSLEKKLQADAEKEFEKYMKEVTPKAEVATQRAFSR